MQGIYVGSKDEPVASVARYSATFQVVNLQMYMYGIRYSDMYFGLDRSSR